MQNTRSYDTKSLQHEYSRHAADFGIVGNWNKANGELFKQAIEAHAVSASFVTLGTFRGVTIVTHYFDPGTRIWATFDQTNTFVAGWKLYRTQIANLLTKGDVT